MAQYTQLDIVTPAKVLLSEPAAVVVVPGYLGEFAVLPQHTPFLSKLKIGELRFRIDATWRYITVMGGYAEVLGDRVAILTPAAEEAVEIDVMRARASRERAEQRLRQAKDSFTFTRAQVSLQRALVRLKVSERRS